ncbi:facilitated trehalose transporter Tret1-like [Schistocerca nitens]|uniref:facilitated trehalose transporter Tret1-like n=1 Tax=Schistocerca nitens TaxID=7011 RepID=UPI002118E3DB|nr:facilitated trehalose transporter Tret1-like [Schistocerca nitens]
MEKGSRRMQYLATLSETLVYASAGTVMGWASPMTQRLDSDGYVNADEVSWLASVNNLAIIAGSLAVSLMVDSSLGRKWSLMAAGVPLAVQWLMLGLSSNPGVLIAARFVGGLGVGVATSVGPMYLAEVAEPAVRGLITTLLQVVQNMGILYMYALGPYVSYGGISGACVVLPLLFMITFCWMPETPYHLLSRGRREDAIKSLLRIRGKTDPDGIQEELESMERAVSEQLRQRRNPLAELRELLRRARHLRGLLVAGGLFFFQIASGMVSVSSYATSIFDSVDAGLDPNVSVMLLAVVQIVVNLAASLVVDRLGRRPLLVASFAGCAASMAVVGAYFYLQNATDTDVSTLGWLPLTALIVYYVFYSFGAGPLPWMALGEVFAPEVKGVAISLVGVFVGLMVFLFVKVFPLAAAALGDHVVFWAEAAFAALGAVFVLVVVPETKGKSLLQITQEMGHSSSQHPIAASDSPSTDLK